MKPDRKTTLAKFGALVLYEMEKDPEWGPDLVERISEWAAVLELARSDRKGMFKLILPKPAPK